MLLLKVRKERHCSLEITEIRALMCYAPIVLCIREVSPHKAKMHLNWSMYLFMDEEPNITEQSLIQSENSLTFLVCQKFLSS